MARAGALMLFLVLSAAVAAPTLGMRMGGPQKDFNKLVNFLKMKKNGYTSLLGAIVGQGETATHPFPSTRGPAPRPSFWGEDPDLGTGWPGPWVDLGHGPWACRALGLGP